jgi:hypothetical protein
MGVADVMLGQVRSVSSVPNGQVDSCRGSCFLRSMHYAVRVGTHWSGAQYPRDTLFKGRNIQELSVGDTSVGTHPPCILSGWGRECRKHFSGFFYVV